MIHALFDRNEVANDNIMFELAIKGQRSSLRKSVRTSQEKDEAFRDLKITHPALRANYQ